MAEWNLLPFEEAKLRRIAADEALLVNGIGKSRYATLKERILHRLFGLLPREI